MAMTKEKEKGPDWLLGPWQVELPYRSNIKGDHYVKQTLSGMPFNPKVGGLP